jgi:hypothetical protein
MTSNQLAKAQSVTEIKNCNGTNCAGYIGPAPAWHSKGMLVKDLTGNC